MSLNSRTQLSVALLVAAKAVGIAALILGALGYRVVGGALLAVDGVLLAVVMGLGLRAGDANARDAAASRDEKAKVIEALIRDGTLETYVQQARKNVDIEKR